MNETQRKMLDRFDFNQLFCTQLKNEPKMGGQISLEIETISLHV